jgi:hypothetical protein
MTSNIILAAMLQTQNTTILESLSLLDNLEKEERARKRERLERRAGTGTHLNLDTLGDEIWKEQFRCVIMDLFKYIMAEYGSLGLLERKSTLLQRPSIFRSTSYVTTALSKTVLRRCACF